MAHSGFATTSHGKSRVQLQSAEARVCGDDVAQAKPHPEIYQRTFAKLDIDPCAALVIEDAVAGIQAARAAGAGAVVGVEGTCSVSQLSAAGASRVIRGVSDLPRFLCDTYENAVSTED